MPKIIDSAAWTGRRTPEPQPAPAAKPEPKRFQDDLARYADEYGIEFASKVAASYNAIWRFRAPTPTA